MSKEKKTQQLGMNPSTANGRLVKDLLFDFVKKSGIRCYRCGEELTRATFSIEHKEAWLDSHDPVGLFFDINNISYSHLSCNVKEARRVNKKYDTVEERKAANAARQRESWGKLTKEEQQARRKEKYAKYNC